MKEESGYKECFNIVPILITTGKVREFGNSYHIVIKKEDAKLIGENRLIQLMIFEYNNRDKKPDGKRLDKEV